VYEYICISKKEGQGKELKELLGEKKLEKKLQKNGGKYSTVMLKLSRSYVGDWTEKNLKLLGMALRDE
jgi:hypothetical protein